MVIDISAIEQDILQAVGIALATVAIWAINQVGAKFKVDKNSAIISALDDAAKKGIDAGVSDASQLIREKGWDHADVKNAVAATAVQQILDHSQTALAQAGYDPSTPAGQAAVVDIVNRALTPVMAEAAASPSTPPVVPPAAP